MWFSKFIDETNSLEITIPPPIGNGMMNKLWYLIYHLIRLLGLYNLSLWGILKLWVEWWLMLIIMMMLVYNHLI